MALPRIDPLDDNLDLAVGQLPGTTIDTTQKEIEELGKTIIQKTNATISAATKSIIPNIPKMIENLTKEINEGKSGEQFAKSIKRFEMIIDELGIDLRNYNSELADFLREREEKGQRSDEKIRDLREQGIVAEKDALNNVVILTQKEIRAKEILVNKNQVEIKQKEKQIDNLRKDLQEKKGISKKEKETITEKIKSQVIELKLLKDKVELDKQTLDPKGLKADTGGDRETRLPGFLGDMQDAFMAPFQAIGDATTQLKEGFGSVFGVLQGIAAPIKGVMGVFNAIFVAVRGLLANRIFRVIAIITAIVKTITTFGKDIADMFIKAYNFLADSFIGKMLGMEKKTTFAEDKKMKEDKEIETFKNQKTEETQRHEKQKEERIISQQNIYKDQSKDISKEDKVMMLPKQNPFVEKEGGSNIISQVGSNMKGAAGNIITRAKEGISNIMPDFQSQTKEFAATNNMPIIIQNNNNARTTQNSGTVVSGYVDNRPDETFVNINNNSMAI
jgi:hypothetical protein